MTTWTYLGDWPAEPRAAVEAAFAGIEWLVPAWCHEVNVRWEPAPGTENEGAAASTNISYEYRWASIRVHPLFFTETAAIRQNVLMHELLHVFTGPLAEYAEQVVDRLLKEEAPKFHETVRAEMTARLESAVQDLANVLQPREAAR